MYRVVLTSMPFADLATPSIALTQLRAVTIGRCPDCVSVEILYLTHDIARYLGVADYTHVWNSGVSRYAGLGDWLFRAVAFPDLPDNTDAYVRRFFGDDETARARMRTLVSRRSGLDALLDELIDQYAIDGADMVGFTSMFMQNVASFAMARKVKQRNPRVITVMGGANCEYPMGAVIAARVPAIDYVFSGPALRNFPEFVSSRINNAGADVAQPGVFSRHLDVPSTVGRDVLGPDLDINVPIALDYDEFIDRVEKYFPDRPFKPIVMVETSRGCWWGQRAHCTFCGLNGSTMAFRAMDAPLAIAQIQSVFRYRGRASVIQAVDNILPANYIREVLPYLGTPDDMQIFYELKLPVDPGDLAVLAKAGVRLLQPGIEALATSTLRLMKKGTTSVQNIDLLKQCAALGIKPFWNLLIGFPGETADVYRRYVEILPLLTHLCPPTGVYPLRFDRYSPYHREPERYGLDLHPMDFYAFIYPFDDEDLRQLAYYFTDRNAGAPYARMAAEWIEPLRGLVRAWQARWSEAALAADPPLLRFINDGEVLFDSRGETVIERRLGPLADAMLSESDRGIHVDHLLRRVPAHGADPDETLSLLENEGLLFREGDHVISLVVRADTPVKHRARQPSMTPSERFRRLPVIQT